MTTAESIRQPRGAFAALTSRGYRIYLTGQSMANIGTWMQSIAQDWLIFTLTHSSTAVGVTMALQFLPILVLGLHAGGVADRLPKRRILLTTQTLNAIATGMLAAITIAGLTRPGDVYAFAFASGLVFAFDAPARQAFVAEVAPPGQLPAAIALNAAVFQSTRLIGPAISSVLIVSVGPGWAFAVNAACYLGPTIGLLRLRPSDMVPAPAVPRAPGSLLTAVRYVRRRPDVLWTIFLVGMVGTFGLNFPIVLTAMAKSAFHGSAGTYGMFNIVLAVGSAAGALLAGAAARPRWRFIVVGGCAFGVAQAVAALAPSMVLFLPLLVAMGFVNLAFQSMANSFVQLAVEPELRGRIMGLYMLVFVGGTPIGAPVIGAVTSHFGARAGMLVCGLVPAVAAVVAGVATGLRDSGLRGSGLRGSGLEGSGLRGSGRPAVLDGDPAGALAEVAAEATAEVPAEVPAVAEPAGLGGIADQLHCVLVISARIWGRCERWRSVDDRPSGTCAETTAPSSCGRFSSDSRAAGRTSAGPPDSAPHPSATSCAS
ncbi:MAG TPA: MFS transporter [Trebonia sp.]|nr:MFS transporter [Trebonia sp.]